MNAQKVVVYTPSGRAMDGFVAGTVWQTPDGRRFPTKRDAVQHMKRCVYRDCDRKADPNWTTCSRHHSAGRSTKQR